MFLTEQQLSQLGLKSYGKNVLISSMASIYNPSRISIGDNVRIDDFCILSAGEGGITIGNYVHIACYASLIGKGHIFLDDYSGISSRVSVYSSTDNYDGEFMTNPCVPKEFTNTRHEDVHLGKHVVVGTGSVILPGVKLENGCAVWAMAVVSKSFPANTILGRISAKPIGTRKSAIYDHQHNLENPTVILTSIYSEFYGTENFRKSVERIGMPLYNAFTGGHFTGNGDVMKMKHTALLELRKKFRYAIYSDGADTVFFRSFTPPSDRIIYSAEKACYPIESLADQYPDKQPPWCYLNAGNWCAPIDLMIEFMEKYGLTKYSGDVNGQKEVTEAYLQAKKDGFPIFLDQKCEYFQTIAFEHEGDFSYDGFQIVNNIYHTRPRVAHGNGRTDMKHIYELIP